VDGTYVSFIAMAAVGGGEDQGGMCCDLHVP